MRDFPLVTLDVMCDVSVMVEVHMFDLFDICECVILTCLDGCVLFDMLMLCSTVAASARVQSFQLNISFK